MTRQMREHISCPKCGYSFSKETAFSRWVRSQKELDSRRDGIVIYDLDMIVHRYKYDHDRLYQCIMLVELKRHGAELTDSQRDTLAVFGQFLRNDRRTSTKGRRAQVGSRPTKVISVIRNRRVTCRAFGVHILTFQRTNPDNGWVQWDKRRITKDQLIKLLKFELHPETLLPMDARKHHRQHPLLFESAPLVSPQAHQAATLIATCVVLFIMLMMFILCRFLSI